MYPLSTSLPSSLPASHSPAYLPRCFSAVGRQGGRQELSVGGTCTFARGTIMHEMMHAVGFHHEQTRTDRDQFVTIFFQNIQPGKSSTGAPAVYELLFLPR